MYRPKCSYRFGLKYKRSPTHIGPIASVLARPKARDGSNLNVRMVLDWRTTCFRCRQFLLQLRRVGNSSASFYVALVERLSPVRGKLCCPFTEFVWVNFGHPGLYTAEVLRMRFDPPRRKR